jgi:hypothetical protein
MAEWFKAAVLKTARWESFKHQKALKRNAPLGFSSGGVFSFDVPEVPLWDRKGR